MKEKVIQKAFWKVFAMVCLFLLCDLSSWTPGRFVRWGGTFDTMKHTTMHDPATEEKQDACINSLENTITCCHLHLQHLKMTRFSRDFSGFFANGWCVSGGLTCKTCGDHRSMQQHLLPGFT